MSSSPTSRSAAFANTLPIATAARDVRARARVDGGRRDRARHRRSASSPRTSRSRAARRGRRAARAGRRAARRAGRTPTCRSSWSATSTRARAARPTTRCARPASTTPGRAPTRTTGRAHLLPCRDPLDDPADALRARIDLILTRGEIAATEAFVVGDAPARLPRRAVAVRPRRRRRDARAGLISTLVGDADRARLPLFVESPRRGDPPHRGAGGRAARRRPRATRDRALRRRPRRARPDWLVSLGPTLALAVQRRALEHRQHAARGARRCGASCARAATTSSTCTSRSRP